MSSPVVETRESTTLLSRWPQNGHFMIRPLPGPAAPAGTGPVLHVRSYDEAGEQEGRVGPPEAERVAHGVGNAELASNVGHVVETALGVLVFEVDGRTYHPFGDRERSEGPFE